MRGRLPIFPLLAVFVLMNVLSGKAFAQFEEKPPPDWIVRGFEAAVAEGSDVTAGAVRVFGSLIAFVPPGDRAGTVIDKLLPLLGDDNVAVRAAAARSLGDIASGDRASAVIDKLLLLLSDRNADLRGAAARALGTIAPSDRAGPVIDKLLPLLSDDNDDARGAAAYAIGNIRIGDRAGAVLDKLLPLFGDRNDRIREFAAYALKTIMPRDGAVIDKLLPLLGDNNAEIRATAAQTLGIIRSGDRVGAVIDKLLLLLGDSNAEVRAIAAQTLGTIAPGDKTGAVIDKLLPLLGDSDAGVRTGAITAFGTIAPGNRAGAVIDKLLPLLGDRNDRVRGAAADTLGTISPGDRVGAVIDKLRPLLGDSDVDVVASAACALEAMIPGDDAVTEKLLYFLGDTEMEKAHAANRILRAIAKGGRADAVVDAIASRLGDSNAAVRADAARAFETLAPGDRAGAVIDKLLSLLGDANADLRGTAVRALGTIALNDRAGAVIDKLLPLLGDSEDDVRGATVQTLGKIASNDRAGAVIDKLLPLLGDSNFNVRWNVIDALGTIELGDRTGAVIDKLLPLFDESDSDLWVAVARALRTIAPGNRASAVIDKLLPLLGDSNDGVRYSAAQALGSIAPSDSADAVIERLLPLLGDRKDDVRSAALTAISQLGPGGINSALAASELIDKRSTDDTGWLRAAAHIATGADVRKEHTELLLAWLGRPASLPNQSVADSPRSAQTVLELLLQHWGEISRSRSLRDEAENDVMAVVYAACHSPAGAETLPGFLKEAVAWVRALPLEGPLRRCWSPEQKSIVEQLLVKFRNEHSTYETALAAHINSENFVPIGKWLTWSVLSWTLFWLAFLVAFPWSRTVQSVFFWNPRAREMLSLWFVPLLLLVIPPLRRRLLVPFQSDLLAAAHLDDLPSLGYFGEGLGRVGGGEPIPVQRLLAGMHGVVVMRGDAGLGKTSALRWVAAKATRPVAFLHARSCAEGVDTAISRLIHDVQERGFVRSLVHTGALIVIVDGLNEVSADTREKVGGFARDLSRGDIFVGTQPIEWRPPESARIIDLLPLRRAEMEGFLRSRPIGADAGQACHGMAYAEAVSRFLRLALDEAPSEEERQSAELMLSNPFDLAFAADLLAQGQMPSPTALIDEAFRISDEGAPGQPGYREINGRAFPLKQFGKHVVMMRLDDRNWFNPEEFPAETSALLDQKLLISRSMKGATGIVDRILFRHDRVWDFFMAAAFRDDPDMWTEHAADPRFRGVYLRIAETWEPESAKRVREQLNLAAAESGDHSTNDDFIKRLEKRLRPKRAARSPKSTQKS